MSLLDEDLPEFSLRPRLPVNDFFGRCERLAADHCFDVDRRAGHVEQLNIYVGGSPSVKPMIRMIAKDASVDRIRIDVVDDWSPFPSYEQYVLRAKQACAVLLDKYEAEYHTRLRIGIPRRKPHFNPESVDPNSVAYAHIKFSQAIRDMAVGEGDVRSRLEAAYWTLEPIDPDELPTPLDTHFRWICQQLTRRERRWPMDSSVRASLASMQNKTGRRIAERLLEIHEALEELYSEYGPD